jgi:hypothetical protein
MFSAVCDDDQGSLDVPQQLPEKLDDVVSVDGAAWVVPQVESRSFRARGHRQRSHYRDVSPATDVLQDWRTSAGRPRLPDTRDLGDARLVDEADGRARPLGFFLMRGQSLAFHSSTFA